jgi:beta-lactamase class A
MRKLGAENSLITHAPGYFGDEYGYLESDGVVENLLAADDLTAMLGAIWRGEGLSQDERDYVLWSLTLATPFLDSAFRAPLPADVAAFHKIGVLYHPDHTWNDAGQEYAYAVAFLSSQNQATYLDGYWLNRTANDLAWQTFNRSP